MKRLTCLLGTVLFVVAAIRVSAENSVVIESKSVTAGEENVTVAIYVTNDFPVAALVIPLEIRMVSGGAFIAGSFTATTQGRLSVFSGGAGIIIKYHIGQRTLLQPPLYAQCPLDSLGRVWISLDSVPDFVSPDAYQYAVFSMSDAVLSPGSDGAPGSETPSVLLTFGVTDQSGTFEIDTTCTAPANTLVFFGEQPDFREEHPAFTKGVFEVGCACSCHGDPVCDSVHTLLDLSKTIGVAFRGYPPVIDPNPMCPYTDTDVNCDGVTSVIDVGKMRNVVFMGANPATEFCNPCP